MNPNKTLRANGIASLLAITLALGASQQCSKAVPYASGISNNSGTISFILNENADNVKVIFDSGTSTNDLGALAKGLRSFSLGASTNYQIVVSKKAGPGFITADPSGTNAIFQQISADTNVLLSFLTPRGIAVNNNPSSPLFGRIYIGNSTPGTFTSNSVTRTVGRGIYMLNADQSDAKGLGNTASTGGLTFSSVNAASPYRLSVGPDDTLYIADWSDDNGNVYSVDGNVSGGSGQVILQPETGTAAAPVGSANNHGSIAAVAVTGSLAAGNLKVYTIDEDLQQDKTAPSPFNQLNSLWEYDINAGPFPYASDPTLLAAITGKEGINTTSQTMDMARGSNGYFYISDYRSTGNEAGVVTRDVDGTTLWNSYTASKDLGGTTDFLNKSTGLAVSPDQKYLALVRDDNRVNILQLTNGIPDLSKRLFLAAFTSTSTGVGSIRSICFDSADNLYVVTGGAALARVFSPGGTTVALTGNDTTGTNGTFSVITKDPDIFTQPQNITATAGSNVTFTVSATGMGKLKYQWVYGPTNIATGTASSFTRNNVQNTTNNVGPYYVIISNQSGNSITSSVVTLTVVDSAPVITTQPVGKTNAAGVSFTLNVSTVGTDARSYQWKQNGVNIAGATTTAYTKANSQTNDSGSYTVTITNSLGSVTSTAVNVLVTNTPPVFNAQPKSVTVNAGANATFTTTLTQASTNNLVYQWRLNGTPIAGATGTSYVTNNVQIASSGSVYSVTVSNLFGGIVSSNAVLTVNDVAPILSTQPKSMTNGAGSNIVFTVNTSAGTDPRTYQWQYEGVDIIDATNSSLVLTNIQFSNAGNYSVTVLNPLGSTPSTNALLTVTNRAPIITAAPVGISANPGDSASFTINANGATNLTYQWSFAGSDISGATDSTLNLSNVQLADAGFYTVVVGSGAGTYSTTNSAAQLAVTIPSTPGTGTGVRGDYYTIQNQTFTNAPTLTRIDTNIDFNFGTGSPDPSISVDRFTVRWTGQVQPLYSQDYTFYTRSDDGARLWVNGQLVVNRWQGQSVTEIASAPVSLTAGQKYDLVMEYFEGTSTAEVHLLWSSLSQVKSAVPMSQLYPAAIGSAITPTLSSSFNGTNSVFNWTGSYTLQTAISIDGPWTNAAALGVGPFTYTNSQTSDLQRYFRLKAN
jgi:PA14 domain/Immunoglobulin domain/Immunoglobulin I-set domain